MAENYEQNEVKDIQDYIDSLDIESRMMYAHVSIGHDAISFLQSDIGRYLVGCAQQEYVVASSKLKKVAFWRKRRIQQIQNEMWRAEMFTIWLRDLINIGHASEFQLKDREET